MHNQLILDRDTKFDRDLSENSDGTVGVGHLFQKVNINLTPLQKLTWNESNTKV